jgi:hypothetical protein
LRSPNTEIAMVITDAKELGRALRDGQQMLEIGGELRVSALRLRALGRPAWWVVVSSLRVAIPLGLIGLPVFVAVAVASGALVLLGAATIHAIQVGAAAGDVDALGVLRSCRHVGDEEGVLRLKRTRTA